MIFLFSSRKKNKFVSVGSNWNLRDGRGIHHTWCRFSFCCQFCTFPSTIQQWNQRKRELEGTASGLAPMRRWQRLRWWLWFLHNTDPATAAQPKLFSFFPGNLGVGLIASDMTFVTKNAFRVLFWTFASWNIFRYCSNTLPDGRTDKQTGR